MRLQGKAWRFPPAAVVPLGLILLWKAATIAFRLPHSFLPAPEGVVIRLVSLIRSSVLQKNFSVTALEIIIGFLCAAVLGLLAGYILAKSAMLEKIFSPFILVFQTAPKISLAPLFVLWLGLGLTSKVVLIALVAFFPIMLNFMVGIRSINPDYLRMLKIFKSSPLKRVVKVEFIGALPFLMTGMRTALVLSVTAAIIGEMMGAKNGLGFLLMNGYEMYDIPMVIGVIFVISFFSWALDAGMKALQDRLLFWHESSERM
mgnify:CR=1 FL=1